MAFLLCIIILQWGKNGEMGLSFMIFAFYLCDVEPPIYFGAFLQCKITYTFYKLNYISHLVCDKVISYTMSFSRSQKKSSMPATGTTKQGRLFTLPWMFSLISTRPRTSSSSWGTVSLRKELSLHSRFISLSCGIFSALSSICLFRWETANWGVQVWLP